MAWMIINVSSVESNFAGVVGPVQADTEEEAIQKAAVHILTDLLGFKFTVLSKEGAKEKVLGHISFH